MSDPKQRPDRDSSGTPRPGASILDLLSGSREAPPRIRLREDPFGSAAQPLTKVSASIGDQAGKYQLQGEIAQGGVGVVLKGHDMDLGRDVALKLLHDRYAENPDYLERFIEEAQIGGQLQHPGIVPVYDLGITGDRPFFTMKLIKGRTFAEVLERRTSPKEKRRHCLAIFEQVCQTMAYTHARGVIHRDLKPANIMVGSFGEVQVVDWGMGKVLQSGGVADEKRSRVRSEISVIETVRSGDGSQSLAGSVMGTPAYMPPEQARGDVDHVDERGDVFSLGAILCEILTGHPPYVGPHEKLLAMAANAVQGPCRQRLIRCGADKQLIKLAIECLMPATSARPKNAKVVADRIGQYIASVEERAAAALVEMAEQQSHREAARRARKLTILLAAVILGGVMVVGGGWWLVSAQQERREEGLSAEVSLVLEEAAKHTGAEQWQQAVSAADRAHDLVKSPDATEELRARVEKERSSAQARLTEAEERERFADENHRLFAHLSEIRQPEGDRHYPTDWQQLDALYGQCFSEFKLFPDTGSVAETAATFAVRGATVEIAAALDEWSLIRRRANNEPGAERLVRVANHLDTDETRADLRRAIAEGNARELVAFAKGQELSQLPTSTLVLLGGALRKERRFDVAAVVLEAAYRGRPDDFVVCMSLARTLRNTGPIEVESKEQGQARKTDASTPTYVEPSVANTDRAMRYHTAALALRPESAEARHELGILLEGIYEHERAEAVFREAVQARPDDGHLLVHLGRSLGRQQKFDEALQVLHRARALVDKPAWCLSELSYLYWSTGKAEEAIVAAHEAIEADPRQANGYYSLVVGLCSLGRGQEAEEILKRGLDHIEDAPMMNTAYGHLRNSQGRFEESLEFYDRAIERAPLLEKVIPLASRAHALLSLGRIEDAEESLNRALEIDPRHGSAHVQRANLLFRDGRLDAAHRSALEAVRYEPGAYGARATLGMILANQGRWAEAKEALDAALEMAPEAGRSQVLVTAGFVARLSGDAPGAEASFRNAVEENPTRYLLVHLMQILGLQGKFQEAFQLFEDSIDAIRKSVAERPSDAFAHASLAQLLRDFKGDLLEATAEFEKALEANPSFAEYWCELGQLYQAQGRYGDAVVALKRGHDLGTRRKVWGRPSAQWLRTARDLADREETLLAISEGLEESRSARDLALAADLAFHQGRHRDALRCWDQVLEIDPEHSRDGAIAVAARIGMSESPESAGLSYRELRECRRKALQMLREELLMKAEAAFKGVTHQKVALLAVLKWTHSSDIGLLRGDHLNKIPEDEQAEFRALWTQVDEWIAQLTES